VVGRLTESDGRAILRESVSVSAVAPFLSTNAQVVFGDQNWSTTVIGTTLSYFPIRRLAIGKGQAWTESILKKSEKPPRIAQKFLLPYSSSPAPGFGIFVAFPMLLWAWPKGERLRRIGWFTAFWGMGITLPLYLAVRSHALSPVMYADLSHFGALAKHVLGLTYSKHLGASGSVGAFAMGGRFLALCWKDLTPLGLLLVLAGLGFLGRDWKAKPLFLRAGLVWAALDLGLILTVPYPALETHQVLWPWVVSAFLAAIGLDVLWSKIAGGKWERWVVVVLVFFVLMQGMNLRELLRKRGDRRIHFCFKCGLFLPAAGRYFAQSDSGLAYT